MPPISNRRATMVLYSEPDNIYCHQVRIVLAEKGITHDTEVIEPQNKPELIAELNPYNRLPILLDRELVLYQANIIMEYLDERFPHPPLLPVYPVARSKFRLMLYRIERDWYSLLHQIAATKGTEANKTRKLLRDSILSVLPIFEEKPFFFSDEFSLVDCCLAPFFWRLPSFGVLLPPQQSKAIKAYEARMFERPSFKETLTPEEHKLRE